LKRRGYQLELRGKKRRIGAFLGEKEGNLLIYLSANAVCCIIEIWNLNIPIGNLKTGGLLDTLISGLSI